MTQNEHYEAGVKKKFHLQMLAQRLGWPEDSQELRYAYRYSLQGQPHQRGIHLGSPTAPSPVCELFSPTKAVLTGKPGSEVSPLFCTLLR